MVLQGLDRIDKIGSSTVQHGPFNDRAYLMKLDPVDLPGIVDELQALGERQGYSKIFAKIPAMARAAFDDAGYREEARIPRLYGGTEDGVFLGRYLDDCRRHDERASRVEEVLELARAKASRGPGGPVSDDYEIGEADTRDVEAMSVVYREVFETYPFPIHDPTYLLATMRSHVRYFCARRDGRIAALSSAEMDTASRNAEMTDFATSHVARGHRLAVRLLALMESEMAKAQIVTAYTIARSLSPPMNITFARLGYAFGGTLVNNTNISGSIESMNVWHKPLTVGAAADRGSSAKR